MIKPLILNTPYPDLSSVKLDLKSASIIYQAYAGAHGELTASIGCANRFFSIYHLEDENSKSLFLSIMLAEICHLELLSELLVKLGVDNHHLKFIPRIIDNGKSRPPERQGGVEKALLDAMSFELVSIEGYKKILRRLKDQTPKKVIERIIQDEEYHASKINQMLEEIKINRA